MSGDMKHSGIPWIGEIPKGWSTIPFKAVVTNVTTGLNPRDNFELSKDAELYYVTIRNFKDGKLYLDENCDRIDRRAWEIIQNRSDLRKGDILFASISKDAQCYILDNYPHTWNINESVFALRGDYSIIYDKYLYYSLINPEYYNDLRLDATGTTFQSIKQKKLKDSTLVLPIYEEQQKIASFLDRKCAEIDEMIALQEKIVEELKAYKQSVITEAVTKGLNPDVTMKDSGTDWIGEIPEHWETAKFKSLFQIKKIIAGKLGYDVLSVTQQGLKVKDLSKNEGQVAQDYSKYQLVDIDDFVMNHMDLLTGYIDCATISGVTSPDYRTFVNRKQTIAYNSYYLRIFQKCYKDKTFYHLGQGVSFLGRWRLPKEQLNAFVLPLPSLDEQKAISDFLDTKCTEIDNLISIKLSKIDSLKEYKKSIIYEYVTGKKEVIE